MGVWFGEVRPFSTTAPGWMFLWVITPEIGALTSRKRRRSSPVFSAEVALAAEASALSSSEAEIRPAAAFEAAFIRAKCFSAAEASTLSASTFLSIMGLSRTTSKSPFVTRSPISTSTLEVWPDSKGSTSTN